MPLLDRGERRRHRRYRCCTEVVARDGLRCDDTRSSPARPQAARPIPVVPSSRHFQPLETPRAAADARSLAALAGRSCVGRNPPTVPAPELKYPCCRAAISARRLSRSMGRFHHERTTTTSPALDLGGGKRLFGRVGRRVHELVVGGAEGVAGEGADRARRSAPDDPRGQHEIHDAHADALDGPQALGSTAPSTNWDRNSPTQASRPPSR